MTTIAMRPIRTDADYRRAKARLDELMLAEAGTPEADELDILATLIEVYEREQFPIDLPSPAEAVKFALEQRGMSASALAPLLGGRSRVSEILSGRRLPSKANIRVLHERLGIPLKVLLQEPASRASGAGRAVADGR